MRSWNLTEGDEFSSQLDHCGFVLKACRGDFGKRLDCDIKNIKCQLNDLRNRRDEAALISDKAVKQKKFFILDMDYHDLLLPLVNRVNELEGTVFFLTPGGCLMPVAIELTRPPVDGKPQRKQEFCAIPGIPLVPGYGSLLKPMLRTHCATEPYIIASNRQLSAVHPIFRLLQPHFRYTMEINALACLALINANGIIESSFSPSKYSMLLCSIA
nr:linoleate 13S-lipoxygenase 2-1, chloroplastic [Ipomoea batatas]